MSVNGFKRIHIDRDVADTPVARRYRELAEEAGLEVEEAVAERAAVHAGHTLSSGKREVHVTRFRGAAVKPCTGKEDDYVCCNLHVMNQTTNCPLDCSYCILQDYINTPVTTVHANVAEMIAQLEAEAVAQPARLFRVGTGDLGDALALDAVGSVTAELVPAVALMANVVLELKTKTAEVDQLIALDHRGRTVVSWSINTPHVIATEEHKCAALGARLEAARRVVEAGYPVAFHFDPMIVHEGWESAYPDTVRRIFEAVPADRVAFVSMGSLRFPPAMAATIAERFPKSRLLLGEMLVASDGKMRYLKTQRIALYRTVLAAIRAHGGEEVFAYLCMEPPGVWRRVFARAYASNAELDFAFSASLVERFAGLMAGVPPWSAYAEAGSLGRAPAASAPRH